MQTELTVTDLLRGRLEDGSSPPYNALEFVARKELLHDGSPANAVRAARVSEAQNRRYFHGFLTDAEAEALVGAPKGRANAAREAFAQAGLPGAVYANYGNPGGLTLFFPEIRVEDYNHPAAPRTMAFKWESAAGYDDDGKPVVGGWVILHSPGVALAKMADQLVLQGGPDIMEAVPFKRQGPF